jgi:hypothetical protein
MFMEIESRKEQRMDIPDLDQIDLENLTSTQLRKLITMVSRQTTLAKYKHVCTAQRICSTCKVKLCYACYNRHLEEKHGLEAAVFNDKLAQVSTLFLPEQKIQSSPRPIKPKKEKLNLNKIKQRVESGQLTREEVEHYLRILK